MTSAFGGQHSIQLSYGRFDCGGNYSLTRSGAAVRLAPDRMDSQTLVRLLTPAGRRLCAAASKRARARLSNL